MSNEEIIEEINKYSESVEDTIYMLKPYLFEGIGYSLPTNSSPEFRKHIDAAILLYKEKDLEFKNARTVLDSLDLNYYIRDNQTNSIDIIQDSIVKISSFCAELLCRFDNYLTNKNIGNHCFLVAMIRLKATFQSSVILLRNGYYMEVSTVFRLIYEQLCWSCYAVEQTHINNIKDKSVTKTIKYIKKINDRYPELYSIFSREAHIDPKIIKDYLREESSGVKVLNRSGKECREKTIYLILLIKIYVEIIQYSLEKHLILSNDKNKEFQEIINLSLQNIAYINKAFKGDDNIKLKYSNLL
ncbi:hypothetical protein [Clostridium omnivorum]|uniref:Transcriptional regulator n=1 Tax=Clostridium omnivorum TaxID=1604902 RepID=A0ABQ5N7L2_9CLOT|nr:hypothetical protein [Clostridium sp. E14]GLC31172.1 hypothetical protein bsdE14_25820 [Clostridium sp. E14]